MINIALLTGVFLIILAISGTAVASEVDNASLSTINGSSVNDSSQVTQNDYSDSASPPSTTTRLIFIHHSSGGNWLATGNGNLGSSLNSNNYYVSESDYGWDAQPNDNLGDHTDTPDWPSWFNNVKMPYVYSSTYHSAYSNNIANPGGENEIIMFKSCFPLSEVGGSIDDEKAIYNSLLPYFAAHQNKFFVLITPPGETQVSSYQLTRDLCNWLTDTENGWLKGYSGNNVFAFDFYCVLSETNSHHRWTGDHVEHVYAADYDGISPYHNGDDHPNSIGNQKATSEFVPLLNVMYNRWKNGGNVTITASANPVGGNYNTAQTVTLTSTSGTTIYYSTDNSDPRSSVTRTAYSTPISIPINSTIILKFAAVDPSNNWSQVYTETYTVSDSYFSVDQIKNAASTVRSNVEIYYNLPNQVQIGSKQVSMPQFLELLTTALLQIKNGNNNLIPLRNCSAPINPKEDIHAGNLYRAEYLKIASDVKNYMDSSGKAPDYAYGTSIGPKLRFENMVYMYSMILDYQRSSGRMADWAEMKPWSSIISQSVSITPSGTTFTVDQIKAAASTLRTSIETNSILPNTVTVGSTQVNMSKFLELLTTALLQINSGNNNLIPERTISNASNPVENIHAGNMYRAEYLKIASDVKNYMDSSGKAPDYAYGTSLGPQLRFESLVYMYAMILDYQRTSGRMADWATMRPWNVVANPVIANFTVNQIKVAASTVRSQIETNHQLPVSVTINGVSVNMSQFLKLVATATIQINNGSTDLIALKIYNAPVNPIDIIHAGNIQKAEYLKIANDIKNYMDSSGKAPDYAYSTSIGNYLSFQNLVYMYSMIMAYYNSSGKIADWAGMKPWAMV